MKKEQQLLQFISSIIEYLNKEIDGTGSSIRNKRNNVFRSLRSSQPLGSSHPLYLSDEIFNLIDSFIDGDVRKFTKNNMLELANKKFKQQPPYDEGEILATLTTIKNKHGIEGKLGCSSFAKIFSEIKDFGSI